MGEQKLVQMVHMTKMAAMPTVMPQGLGLGGAGGQKFNFLNMVMWHIKLNRPSH